MKISQITPKFVGYMMATPAVHDEEGFGDRISLWSEKDGKTYVWTRDYFTMIKKDNPKLAIAVVKKAGEWRGSLPDSKLLGNDCLGDTMNLLEYGPWITNDDETGLGLALLVEWGRFALKNKEVYENIQAQISEFVEYLKEECDPEDAGDDSFDYSENLQDMWESRDDFLEKAKLFIDTKWEDVPQHGNPELNTDVPNLKKLDYPEQPEQPEDDNFEPYGESDEDDDFSETSGFIGGGSRMANSLLKKLAKTGANIIGVPPGGSATFGIGGGLFGVSKSDNMESKNSNSDSFDKQKSWKDIPDFDPNHAPRPKKKTSDDDDFDFDEDAFKQDLKALLGDDDD